MPTFTPSPSQEFDISGPSTDVTRNDKVPIICHTPNVHYNVDCPHCHCKLTVDICRGVSTETSRCVINGCIKTRVNKKCHHKMCKVHCSQSGGCLGVADHTGASRVGAFVLPPPNPPRVAPPPPTAPAVHTTLPFETTSPRPLQPNVASPLSGPSLYQHTQKNFTREQLGAEWAKVNILDRPEPSEGQQSTIGRAHRPVDPQTERVMLYLYHLEDSTPEIFPLSLTSTQRHSFGLPDAPSLVQFLNETSTSPSKFPKNVRIRNVLLHQWETISFDSSKISVAGEEYNPIVIALSGCTIFPGIDKHVSEGRNTRTDISSQWVIHAARVKEESRGENKEFGAIVHAPSPRCLGLASQAPATPLPPRQSTPSWPKWPGDVTYSNMINGFRTLSKSTRGRSSTPLGKRSDMDDILTRGQALFGPSFKRSTYFNLLKQWTALPQHMKDQYDPKGQTNEQDFLWKDFRAAEKERLAYAKLSYVQAGKVSLDYEPMGGGDKGKAVMPDFIFINSDSE